MKSFRKSYNRLNKEQKKAVDKIDGPLMVVAGPGSGKTELLSVRVANILRKKDIPAGSLLCLTFTDAAALNMKERLVKMIGDEGYKVPTLTFHSFCKEIIDNNPEYFYKGADFELADEVMKTAILEDILSSLDHDNPLSKTYNGAYTFLNDTKKSISDLKDAGLTPDEFLEVLDHNEKILKEINPLISSVFDNRVSKSIFPKIEKLIKSLEGLDENFPFDYLKPLSEVVANSLTEVLETKNTTKISEWKSNWTKKMDGHKVLKDTLYLEKMKALAEVYRRYKERMEKEELFDFSDMILDVIEVLRKEDSLRHDLQEKYQYILVDEFQDTSGVQMRLLKKLTEDEPHNKPNVCIVGDDDQAIYRFQGAEISNILNFRDNYRDVEVVTLTKSYRSGQKILNVAEELIKKAEERLESRVEEVDKNLVSAKKKDGKIVAKEFETKEEEYSYLAEKVAEKIDAGTDPQEIAVMGRTHKILKEVAPFLVEKEVPIFAQRKENVLKKEPVIQVINILRFADYLLGGDKDKAEELLPELLSYPFWELKRENVWKIARNCYKNRSSWMEEMKKFNDLNRVADFLTDLSLKTEYKPVEEIIDIVLGNKKGTFLSPFKEHYFNKEKLKQDPTEYFKFLSALKRFTGALKEYRKKEILLTEDLLDFVDRHEDNDISLNDENPLITDKGAVSLITSHSAKGKEFEKVFVLNCQQEIWAGSKRGSMLPFPANMPIEKMGESRDDQLRLFYVTITRTKEQLFILSHKKKESGKGYSPLEFISHIDVEKDSREVSVSDLEASTQSHHSPPFSSKERDLLLPLAEKYMLSATGFNKFLNALENGPQEFLKDRLLRFPFKKPPYMAYGSAVHQTINWVYNELKTTKKLPTTEDFLKAFENILWKQRMSEKNYKKYLQKGKKALKLFYEERKESFNPDDFSEKDFKNQGVVIADQKLTGKIDKIVKKDGKLEVIDFKTGKILSRWDESGKYQKMKAWRSKNQLIFYKLLIENSTDFEGYEVDKGFLEFVEPDDNDKIQRLSLVIKDEEVERVKSLIGIVGKKIKNLDFPDVGQYDTGKMEDIKAFEEDLLKNN